MSNVTFHFHLQVMYCAKGHSEILAIYIRSKVIVPCTFSTGDTSHQKTFKKQYAKRGSSMIFFDRFVHLQNEVARSNTPVLRHFCQYLMIPS